MAWAARLTGVGLIEQADRLGHGEASLQTHLIAVGHQDAPAQQPPLHPVTEVGRGDGGSGAAGELAHGHLGGDGAPHQIVQIRMLAQHLLHQGALNLPAVVAASCRHQRDRAPRDGLGEGRLHQVVAPSRGGSREEGDPHRRAAGRVAPRQPLTDARPHLGPVYPYLGDRQARCQGVDHSEDRQPAGADGAGQGVRCDAAEQDGIGPLRLAAGNLPLLLPLRLIAPCLLHLEVNPEPARLLHHALIDREPVGVAQVRVEGAESIGARRPLGRGPSRRGGHGPGGARQQGERGGKQGQQVSASHGGGFW